MIDLNNPHPILQLLVSLGLGLLVGLQRQWADAPLGGVRTFALTAMLGTVCAVLAESYGIWIVPAGFAGVTATVVVGNLIRKNGKDLENETGMSTEIGMLLIYGIGVLVHEGPLWLAASTAGALAVILQMKIELHSFAERFTADELKAIMQFVLITLVILPLVPNEVFGPYDVLNPREVWLMVVLIVGISLAGYIVYKFFGENAGLLLGGFLGGLISSTATTVSYSRRSSEAPSGAVHHAALIAIAWTTLYGRVFVEVLVAAPAFRAIWIPLGALLAVSIGVTFWMRSRISASKAKLPPQGNPSEFRTGFVFAGLYTVVVLAVAFAKEQYGKSGLMVVAVLSGITDVDAITLSTSRLVHGGKLSQTEGWHVILMAILANVFFKGVMASVIGGRTLARQLVPVWLATLVTGGLLVLFL